jgi:sugar phosphate isomerase/epimerase
MKIAVSSASFANAIAGGSLTQLEWLDLCANELEADGVVFETEHFPRVDPDYIAQVKKLAVDLGLSVAAVSAGDFFSGTGPASLELAVALGAPVVAAPALRASDDPAAWGAFAEVARTLAASAKSSNVTIALRPAPGTLCENAADLRRFTKDVDSAWLRFAPEPATLGAAGDGEAVLSKAVIAFCPIERLATFAGAGDAEAPAAIRALARFRGFVVLERREVDAPRDAYHRALERFAALRASSLELRPA